MVSNSPSFNHNILIINYNIIIILIILKISDFLLTLWITPSSPTINQNLIKHWKGWKGVSISKFLLHVHLFQITKFSLTYCL